MEKDIKLKYTNGEVTIVWKPKLCIHSGVCVRTLPKVYRPKERPWIKIEHATTEEIKAQISKCPSGALSYFMNDQEDEYEKASEDSRITKQKIEIEKDGPYIVSGNIPIEKAEMTPDNRGIPYEFNKLEEYPQESVYALCRCGHSKNKPFCDDSHVEVNFKGTETATKKKYKDLANTISGPELKVTDVSEFCASARFCARAGGIRRLVKESDNSLSKENAIQEASDCPSGRLIVWDKKSDKAIEPDFEPNITILEDPGKRLSGPIYVKGGIQVISSDGTKYEKRNRVALCRCGKSGNKPFCDGSHIKEKFSDGDKSISQYRDSRSKEEVVGLLKENLQVAVMLEFSTIPPYLTAYWSIHGTSAFAERAKKNILSVIQEEMLHLAMACNMLNAIGGKPVLNDPSHLPSYPCALPGHSKTNNAFLVHLNKCCPQSLTNFSQIELPEELFGNKHFTDGWCTIGEFYDEIELLIKHHTLSDKDFTFGKQINDFYNPGNGKLHTVNCKQDAIIALEEIIDQGEGHSGKMYDKDHELTHYWKFITIRGLMENGLWKYKEDIFNVGIDPDETYFSNEAKELNKKFNILYSEMLDAMQIAISSTSPSLEVAVEKMILLKEPALKMMQIPLFGINGNAAPTFSYKEQKNRQNDK